MRIQIYKKQIDKAFINANHIWRVPWGDYFINFSWIDLKENGKFYRCYGLFIEYWGKPIKR